MKVNISKLLDIYSDLCQTTEQRIFVLQNDIKKLKHDNTYTKNEELRKKRHDLKIQYFIYKRKLTEIIKSIQETAENFLKIMEKIEEKRNDENSKIDYNNSDIDTII